MNIRILLSTLLAVLSLTACGGGSQPESVPTSAQEQASETSASEATPTNTPAPTDTPEPTATPESTWLEFTSEEGNFVVSLPAKPSEQVVPDPDFDDIEIHVFMAQVEDKEAYFGISYRDYPEEFIEVFVKDNIETFFDSTSEEALSTMGGVLVGEEDISLGDFPGRQVTYEIPKTTYPGGGKGVTQSYLVGTRRYEVLALGVQGDLAEEDIEQFFGSFQLLQIPEMSAGSQPSDVASELEWVEFSSTEGGFSVLFPTEPNEQTKNTPTIMGDIEIHMFMAPLGAEAIFGVMYSDFPLDMSSMTTERIELFNSGRDSALANMGGEIVNEEDVLLGQYPGRHIIFEIPNDKFPGGGGKGILRAYLIENRLYQLLALGSQRGITDEDIEFFLDSFTLTEISDLAGDAGGNAD